MSLEKGQYISQVEVKIYFREWSLIIGGGGGPVNFRGRARVFWAPIWGGSHIFELTLREGDKCLGACFQNIFFIKKIYIYIF